MLMTVLDAMDHQYLNELPQFKNQNPTAEHLAQYIYVNYCNKMNYSTGNLQIKLY